MLLLSSLQLVSHTYVQVMCTHACVLWVCWCSLEASSAVSRELMRLMKIPVDNYNNVLELLRLEHYGPLMEYLDYQARKTMSIHIILNALENETVIPAPEQVGCGYN